MPYVLQNGQKYTSHHVTSPLHYIKESCLTCHRGQTEAWALAQVRPSRTPSSRCSTPPAENRPGPEIIRKAADTPNADPGLARPGPRICAQRPVVLDYVAAANSMGFHNSVQEQQTLGQASDLAWQAIQAANQAAGRNLLR
jgi:nitrite reductase (cytochrome c-552)